MDTQPNTGKTILVTGAGGCIGAALTEALTKTHPRFLILLDHSEQNLHEITIRFTPVCRASHVAILGDVRDDPLLTEIFEKYHPQTIYHAAAFKHVPLMESNPIAVVRNNAVGTWELAKAAVKFEAERLLLVSELRALGAPLGLATVLVKGDEARLTFRGTAQPRLARLTAALDAVQFEAEVRRTVPLSLWLRRVGGEAVGPGLVRALTAVQQDHPS